MPRIRDLRTAKGTPAKCRLPAKTTRFRQPQSDGTGSLRPRLGWHGWYGPWSAVPVIRQALASARRGCAHRSDLGHHLAVDHRQALARLLVHAHGMNLAIEALRAGADDFLLKPCDSEELLLRMGKFFEKQDALRPLC